MVDRLVAVDDSNYLLPEPVRNAYLADIQTKLNAGVAGAVAAMPDVVTAVTNKVSTLTTDSAVSTLLDSATTTRGKLDARYAGSGAPTPTGGDDTSSLQTWLNSLTTNKVATLRPLTYSTTGTITIPAGITVLGYGATLKGTTGAADLIAMSSRSRLYGLEIDGSAAGRTGGHGVRVSAADSVTVQDCYIHHFTGTTANDGRGISVVSGSTKYVIHRNRIENVHGQAISLDVSSYGTITGNRVDTAQAIVQWWGGDSAASSTIGIRHLVIAGNSGRNLSAGVWGSLGQFITVTGNDIETCADVGIDFEGCQDCTAVGNTVNNTTNAGLAVFYGSTRILFDGNTVNNTGIAGAGFKAYTGNTNTYIQVTNNLFTAGTGVAVTADQVGIADSTIRGNRIISTTPGVIGVRFIDGGNISIIENEIRVASPTGISFEGSVDSRIEGNEIITTADGSAVGDGGGGVYLVWRSTQYPCQRNRIRNNVIRGFVKGVYDNCWGNISSYNLIENNVATTVYRKAGSGYGGVISNNRNESTHVPVTPGTV